MRNIHLLQAMDVRLAMGYDGYNTDSVHEMELVQQLRIFSNAELLRLWSTDTVQAIFPARAIGSIAEGYDASFLVLAGNPLIDFKNARSIERRFNNGHELRLP